MSRLEFTLIIFNFFLFTQIIERSTRERVFDGNHQVLKIAFTKYRSIIYLYFF